MPSVTIRGPPAGIFGDAVLFQFKGYSPLKPYSAIVSESAISQIVSLGMAGIGLKVGELCQKRKGWHVWTSVN